MSEFINITGRPGQTALDIALKHYGSLEGLRLLMEDNEIGGENILTASDLEGEEIKIRKGVVINKSVADYFANREIVTR